MLKLLKRENEQFPLDQFLVWASRKSQIRDDYYHSFIIGVHCPRCNTINDEIGHNESARCKECNLRMEVHGNGLFCR